MKFKDYYLILLKQNTFKNTLQSPQLLAIEVSNVFLLYQKQTYNSQVTREMQCFMQLRIKAKWGLNPLIP